VRGRGFSSIFLELARSRRARLLRLRFLPLPCLQGADHLAGYKGKGRARSRSGGGGVLPILFRSAPGPLGPGVPCARERAAARRGIRCGLDRMIRRRRGRAIVRGGVRPRRRRATAAAQRASSFSWAVRPHLPSSPSSVAVKLWARSAVGVKGSRGFSPMERAIS
jgi:hypothetical protein